MSTVPASGRITCAPRRLRAAGVPNAGAASVRNLRAASVRNLRAASVRNAVAAGVRNAHAAAVFGFLISVSLVASPVVLTGCDVFSTREPVPPLEDAGTFGQPDTPDQVIVNIENAISELNAQNYRRSFADGFEFGPTASAAATDPSIWTGWGAQDEESYFRAMVQAARLTSGNELRFNETTLSAVTPERFSFDAGYVLTINHRRPDLDATLQGRLVWTLEQDEDGLWRITEWIDRELGDAASWSDLKAEFIK